MDKNKLYELVTSILAKELQIKPSDIEPQKHLAAYGLGSLQAISLAGEFNTILGTKIDFSHLYEYSHLNSLVDFLQEALAKQSKLKFKKKAIEDNKKSLFPCIEDKLKAYNPALYFDEINGLPENKITIENQNYLNFSSYNYLGFAQDKDIINSTINAIEQYGTSVAASRLVGGQRAIHRELEQHIASFLNAEDALVFNSGHATNVTTLGHLFNSNDLIILDELSHNSLVQGAQLAGASIKFFKHNDPDSLAQLLENNINAYAKTLVVTEGIFSMDGDIAPIDKYLALKSKFDFFIYIDEAHSLGVLGEKGRGIVEHYALKSKQIDIWMGTLSKAMASSGGYIAGSKQLINYLRYSVPGFVYSCGLSPADTAAALASLQKLMLNPARVSYLGYLSNYLRNLLQERNINIGQSQATPIIPIIIGNSQKTIELCNRLRKKGIYLHAIVPPVAPEGQARLRIFINYHHKVEDLDYLADSLAQEIQCL